MNIIQRTSPNHTRGRDAQMPELIVNHITEGAFPGSINWVSNPASQVSYHFMVSKAGQITQCVNICDTAWANGTSNNPNDNRANRHSTLPLVRKRNINANSYSVSIGFEGRFNETGGTLTPPQFRAAVKLYSFIRKEIYKIWGKVFPISRKHIVGHYEITPKTRPNCPGSRFPFKQLIEELEKYENKGIKHSTLNAYQTTNDEKSTFVTRCKYSKTNQSNQNCCNMSIPKRFQTINDIEKNLPWAAPDLQKLINLDILQGNDANGKGLDLTIDMIRTIIISTRIAQNLQI